MVTGMEIAVRGVRVRVFEAGTGAPLVWFHGLEGPRWDPLLIHLSTQYRIIMPELPGFGQSSLPEWMFSISDAAFFGLDFVDALQLGTLHLGGYSIGGWVAAEMAIRHATPFSSLTLVSPMGVLPDAPPRVDVFVPGPEAVVRAQFFDSATAEAEIASRASEDVDIVLQNRTGLARFGWAPRLGSVTLPEWLHRAHMPTLILWGEEDNIVPFECHRTFLREIPRAKIVHYPECGHALPYERGGEAAKCIAEFLAETPK